MKFATKLVLLVSGIVFVIAAVGTYLSGASSMRSLEAQIVKRLEDGASQTMDRLDRYFHERLVEVRELATVPLLTSPESSPRQIVALITDNLRRNHFFVSAAFYGQDRVLVADTAQERVGELADLGSAWDEIAAGHDFTIVVSSHASTSESQLLLAHVVRDGGGATRGLLVARLPLGILAELLAKNIHLHGTEDSLKIDLVDRSGLTLYSNYNMQGILREITADWAFIEPMIRAGQTAGNLKHANPAEESGEELHFFIRESGFHEFLGNGWTLSYWISTSDAFAPAITLRNRMIGLFLLAGSVLVAVVFLFVRSFTRPIEELSRAAREIGKGNLDVRVPADCRDELGLFAKTFNQMATDLQKSQRELTVFSNEMEGLVEERTAELLRTNVLLHAELSERVKAQEELAVRERLLRLNADIGEALTLGAALSAVLQRCTEHIVRDLEAAFVRIWTTGGEKDILELKASAGMYTRIDGKHSRKIIGELKIGIIAQEQRPILTNAVIGDPAITDQEWAQREGMVAFAGHPLVVDGRTVGVMALFSRRPLEPFVLAALGTIADKIAAFIGRRQAEELLRISEQRYRELFESSRDGIYTTDAAGIFTSANLAGARMFGHATPADLIGSSSLDYWRDPADREVFREKLQREKSVSAYPIQAKNKDGVFLELESSSRILEDENGVFLGIQGMLRDVTQRVRAEAEQELLIAELQEAAANIRTLSGLLPICAGCKKIRDDKGSWSQIETYISAHSEAEFSHGLCPECQKIYFPGLG